MLAIVEDVMGPGSQVHSRALVNLARTARKAGDFDIARGAIEQLDLVATTQLDQNTLGLALLQGGSLELAEGNLVAAWEYVEPALGLELPPSVEVPIRALAVELAVGLGHRNPFAEFDVGLRASSGAGAVTTRLRDTMLDAARRHGFCHLAPTENCAGS